MPFQGKGLVNTFYRHPRLRVLDPLLVLAYKLYFLARQASGGQKYKDKKGANAAKEELVADELPFARFTRQDLNQSIPDRFEQMAARFP